MTDNTLTRARDWVAQSKRILFITGAGLSADSGLPTYRGTGGLYNQELTEEGLSIEEVLSGETFQSSPELTWRYLLEIENACRSKTPNPGHRAIATLQQAKEVCVLTQNIDGFHQRAGSQNLIEIHGNFHTLECVNCAWQSQVDDYRELDASPTCPKCQATIRPRIVLFGEMLPEDAVDHLNRELEQGFDLIVAVGTTACFPYIAGPFINASYQGVPTLEINPDRTDLSPYAGIHLQMRAAEALTALITT